MVQEVVFIKTDIQSNMKTTTMFPWELGIKDLWPDIKRLI